MRQLVRSLIDIRKGEGALAGLMLAYYYLILVTIYFLKPTRDSLFLVRLGSNQLPVTFILIAVTVLPVTTLYARMSRALTLTRLINGTTVVLIINLVLLRGLMHLDHPWVYYVFYVWVSIYGVLATSQFWLCANTVLNPAQAKRLFPLLNIGGILGAMTGGEVTSLIVQDLGVSTENLLFFCVGFLTMGMGLLNAVWSITEKDQGKQPAAVPLEGHQETFGQLLSMLRRSRPLVWIVGIISLMVMVTAFVDFQFKTVSLAAFPTKAALASFMGKFYGRVGLVALLVQLLLTSRFLRVLGVGGAILILPFSLVLGSAAMFMAPGLWTGVLLRGADHTFRYSMNKTGLELLFLPVPLDLKKRTKVFIDVFIDQWAQGISGVLLLLFTAGLGVPLRSMSLVVIALSGAWILCAIRVRQEYVNAFRSALERREIDLSELRMSIGEASTVQTLIAALSSQHERQVVYALDMLASVKDVDLRPSVQPLFQHQSAEVRQKALRVLYSRGKDIPVSDIESLVNDADQDVRIAAMSLLCGQRERDRLQRLKAYLEHPDLRMQTAAVVCIAEHGRPEEHRLVDERMIQSLLSRDGEEGERIRIQVARALGTLTTPGLQSYLLTLMDDASPAVARHAVESAGQTKNRQFVPVLLLKLADHRYRASARSALTAFGPRILGTLRDYLLDETVDLAIRRNIPRVLRQIPTQESVDILLHNLNSVHPSLRYPVVKALNKLRAQYPALRMDEDRVHGVLMEETKAYYEVLQVRQVDGEARRGPVTALLNRALDEKQHRQFEIIFRLLGLLYPPYDIYHAYQGIVSQNQAMRASALEFLENILRKDLKKYLLPVLDQPSTAVLLQKGQTLFGQQITNQNDAFVHLIGGRDPWIRACAMYTLTEIPTPSSVLVALVEAAQADADPVVCETARTVWDHVQDRMPGFNAATRDDSFKPG